LAAYATFGLAIVERYEAVVAKGDRPAAGTIRWADIRPHVVGAGVGGRYCGMSEAMCERAWIASRDLNTEAKVDGWLAAGTAAKLAAAQAKLDAKAVEADEDASDEDKAKAKADAKAAQDAADHLAYEGTSVKSAVSFAAAKRGGRHDAATHVITPGSGRGGTGGTAAKAVDKVTTGHVDLITRYREGATGLAILPIVGDITVGLVGDLTVEDAKALAKVLAALVEGGHLAKADEVAKADEDDAKADDAKADEAKADEDAKVAAKASLAAELAALAAKLDALT
jgi:hypothetical protein